MPTDSGELSRSERRRYAAMGEAKAAQIIADMFPGPLLRDWRNYGTEGRRPLYVWEREALDWLREWRKRDTDTQINHWTGSYMRYGPPPWGDKK